jgi:hypothetical protein
MHKNIFRRSYKVKKIIAAALTVLLVFVIAACGSEDDISLPDNNGPADDVDIIIDTPQDDEGYQDVMPGDYVPDTGITFQAAFYDGVLFFILQDENLYESYDTSNDANPRILYAADFMSLEGGFTLVNIIGLHINDEHDMPGIFATSSILPHMNEVIKYAQYDIDFPSQTIVFALEISDDGMDTVSSWDTYEVRLFSRIGDYETGNDYHTATRYEGDVEALLRGFVLFRDSDPLSHIPDRGTPPYVTPPLESHEGDRGFFFATSEDYIVYTYKDSWDDLEFLQYFVVSFDENGDFDSTFSKRVFSSAAEAEKFVNSSQQSTDLQMDNVVFYNLDGRSMPLQSSYLETKELAFNTITQEPHNLDVGELFFYQVSIWQ